MAIQVLSRNGISQSVYTAPYAIIGAACTRASPMPYGTLLYSCLTCERFLPQAVHDGKSLQSDPDPPDMRGRPAASSIASSRSIGATRTHDSRAPHEQ